MTISPPSEGQLNLQEIIALTDKASSDTQKDLKATRKLNHLKKMNHLDQNIHELKTQQSQLSKAKWFNFIIGMVSNVFNALSSVLSAVLPGVGPMIAKIGNSFLQKVLELVGQMNPHQSKADQAQIKAKEFEHLAQADQFQQSIEEERLQAEKETQQLSKKRLEQALNHIQEGQRSVIRV